MLFAFILVVAMTTGVTPVTHRHVGPVLVPRVKTPGDESDGSGESGDGDPYLTSDPAYQPTAAPDRSDVTVSAGKDDEDDFSTYIDTEDTQEVLSTGVADIVSFTERPITTTTATTTDTVTASTVQTNGVQHRTVALLTNKRTSRDSRERQSNNTKVEASFCPVFCCTSNVTCRYDYEVLPVCSCNQGNPYETCELSDGDSPVWADVLKMAPDQKRGVCMELWDRDQNNITRYRLHCHVTGVQDFTYTSVHWNASAPDDAPDSKLPNQRPCLMFIKRAGPPLRNKSAMDETLQYAGFAMIFVFIGVIMCSCRNQEATDEDEPLERKASDAWVDS
ncbi:uncharacterized protein LOC144884694 [Branchiostoma floridae x Branchiostoma japonicum]